LFEEMGPHRFQSRLQFQDIRYRGSVAAELDPFRGMTGLPNRDFMGKSQHQHPARQLEERKRPCPELRRKQTTPPRRKSDSLRSENNFREHIKYFRNFKFDNSLEEHFFGFINPGGRFQSIEKL
jgi:hypothetical protein